MTDSTLQRVWDSRTAISKRCEFDARKLVHFYQSLQDNKNCTETPFQRNLSRSFDSALSPKG